tara:strand:- start:166 stop:741 length:576 start_codon:yes stop_codon:yes gene_type:complete
MQPDKIETDMVKRVVNLLLIFALIGFGTSAGMLANQWLSLNKQGLEAKWFPPTEDWTFREWNQEDNGHWSAEVYYYKNRAECLFVPEQILTATFLTPRGDIGESLLAFIGDKTEGNTRPTGWQRIDMRVEFLNPNISHGSLLRGTVLHQCHDGLPTVSGFREVVAGQDMPWPSYVQEWIDLGRLGMPSDYR